MSYTLNEFIKEHLEVNQYKNYCEAIIYEDGTIEYATPSHTEKLISVSTKRYGITRDQLFKLIPMWASPVHWLAEYNNTAIIWYDFAILSKDYTKKQISTIKALMRHKILNRVFDCSTTDEIETCCSSGFYKRNHPSEVFTLRL